jgi:hypothetical protein
LSAKRGNRYLRMLFIQGARAVLLHPAGWATTLGRGLRLRRDDWNKLIYRSTSKGSRRRATHDQRTQSIYLFGAAFSSFVRVLVEAGSREVSGTVFAYLGGLSGAAGVEPPLWPARIFAALWQSGIDLATRRYPSD